MRLPAIQAEAAADMLQLTLAPFDKTLAAHGHETLQALRIDTLQVNVGKLCNQTCTHCHVDAGPLRTEIMTRGRKMRIDPLTRWSRYDNSVSVIS